MSWLYDMSAIAITYLSRQMDANRIRTIFSRKFSSLLRDCASLHSHVVNASAVDCGLP
jgi:hypothetical protein